MFIFRASTCQFSTRSIKSKVSDGFMRMCYCFRYMRDICTSYNTSLYDIFTCRRRRTTHDRGVGESGLASASGTSRTLAFFTCQNVTNIQGALSTIVGMISLVGLEAYIVLTFFKTMLLVILFGLMHSLLVLPVTLALIVPRAEKLCVKKV